MNPDEPKPHGEVTRPESLSEDARGIWERLAPVCLQMGTLTVADVPAFATLCELESTRLSASAQKNAERFAPFLVSEDYNGADKLQIHPALKLERETATALRPFYDYFGMTPSGRARIRVPKTEEPKSKWAGKLA